MRVAVLGCGSIGRRHLKNLQALGVSELAAFEPDAGARERTAAELGVAPFSTLDDVWQWRPQATVVASPTHCHLAHAEAAVAAGAHVFVEKPLADRLDGVDAVIRQAHKKALVTLTGCNMRFHPGPAAVHRLIQERAIGDVLSARLQTGSYLPGWRPGTDFRLSYSADAHRGGGALLDCIHEIDLALWYFGPARLSAAHVQPATSLGLTVDGLAELLLAHDSGHDSGAVSSVHVNFVQRDYRRSCQIIGSEGTIYWDFGRPVVIVARGSRSDTIDLPAEWSLNTMYVDELQHFLTCVETRIPTLCPLEAGAAALEIALDARAAATPGTPTRV